MSDAESRTEDKLSRAVESQDDSRIKALAEDLHPADLADFLTDLDDQEQDTLLTALHEETIADAAEHLSPLEVADTLAKLPTNKQKEVLDDLPDDELVDLLQEVSEPRQEEYISLLSEPKKAVSSNLLQYPETTAGGRMTTALATVRQDMTIREAIDSLRQIRESTEILSRIIVVDDFQRILGKIRLRDLTFAPRGMLVRDIMDDDTTSIDANADQEEAAQMIAKYDLMVLPVVNQKMQIIGVITHDDAIEILEEESTEDIERMSGIGGGREDEDYLQIPVMAHFKKRFLWVLFLALLALLSGWVLLENESVFKPFYVLALYLPMVVAAGGNTGAQSATAVIRAMALGELDRGSFLNVIWKEFRIGVIMGTLLGICIALQVRFFLPETILDGTNISILSIAAIVGFSLTMQVTSSTLFGALLPIIARSLRLDPAVVASPAITTLVDVSGMVIYFGFAKILLGL
jgi:magnesium transporter